MRIKPTAFFLLPLTTILLYSFHLRRGKYEYTALYSPKELKEDLYQVKEIFEKEHPRPFEYTSRQQFSKLFDSLAGQLTQPLTEREFQYFLLPIVGKIHCSHTKISPSQYLKEHLNDFISAPPFKLYFDSTRAFLKEFYGSDSSIVVGSEVISVNGIKMPELVENYSRRISNEGKNKTFIFNRLNFASSGLFPAICDYPGLEYYTLILRHPASGTEYKARLKSISQLEYAQKALPTFENYSFRTIDSLQAGLLTIKSFKFDYDSLYKLFLDNSISELKEKHVKTLIIDLRGNIGGLPQPAAALLSCLSGKSYQYYNRQPSWKFENTISPGWNYFNGEILFLCDGGCRSTTGHFVSLVKYHKLGTIVGEETCASFSCNNNGTPFTLKNTKIIFECPQEIYQTDVKGITRGHGIFPDILAKPTVADVLSKHDAVLASALQIIKRSAQTFGK